MKTFGTLLVVFFISFSTSAQEFKFEKETIDYGKISKGSNGERVFIFTNTGTQPLIIKNIQSSCGCTVPKKPEKPIMPGEKGEIKVSYDTKRVGGFSKAITIFSNAKNARKVIKIKGIVNKGVSLQKEKSMLSNFRD
ncbi:Protein of unknown function [Polaribacter sp. Hel1_33_78]|jgi:hypothetical protein|uniref:DUF1573 domain-containing protein n=1 Tax=unclassified Polaribacter TaxID=196858 RepID=UPI00087DBC9F|nr:MULTISPECIES: DUF1573 domain-containing protein [unclassified Polaribacter]MBT3741186.1 DUF1573 domain-containing protein [Polaribacter sp.]MBT4412482.1 DUF1573 domain-containing protein [Polaribacter sp.]MBT7815884.1 DUF1573 domain-containing protein [Polaribacter sp.]MDG1194569.1 DUF1573 domain-containing protein [Polaribacter sp.]MDG1402853.1 DUF1573 domain-containing protein [Polaribacter sp.]